MSNKKIVLIMIMTFILPLVIAGGNFNIYEGTDMGPVCPTSTGLFTDAVENTGDEPLEFTISSAGTSAPFATIVPQGFILAPGEVRTIFSYITPMSTTNVGQYSLSISLDSNDGSQTINHPVTVRDCFDYSIEAVDQVKHICPCESEKFDFEIKNSGEYTETYYLSVEGQNANQIVLSEEVVSLTSGETKLVYAYATSSCNDLGEYDFTVISNPASGPSVKSAGASLVVDACYDFDIQTEQDLIAFCEHSQISVPIEIENDGSTSNTYYFDLNGPIWANLENNKLDIPASQSKNVNMILTPDYGVEGMFEVGLEVSTERGEGGLNNVFNIQVRNCYSVSIDLTRNSDKICNALENTYGVIIRNDGELTKAYVLELDGPDWATLETTRVDLEAGAEEEVTLTINPAYNVVPATYSIKIRAKAVDSEKVATEEILEITTVSKEECYQANIGLENDEVAVYYDASATVPVVIENMGTYTATYDLTLTGTAANFVYMNPAVVTIDEAKSELVYLYIAPSAQVPNGNYEATISARLGDSTILATKSINIKVTDNENAMPTGSVVLDTTGGPSIFSRLADFFKSLFATVEETEDLVDDVIDDEVLDDIEEDFTNETIEDLLDDVEDELNETTEEEPETEEGQEEEIEEVVYSPVTVLLGLEEVSEFNLGEEEHTITLTDVLDSGSIVITINSDPILVELDIGETQEVDIDNDGTVDLIVRFDGMVGDKADLSYEYLTVEGGGLSDITGDVVEDTEVKEPLFEGISGLASEIRGYSDYLIGIIIILIILLLAMKTDFHKKIIDFFEEEIEEENYTDLTVDETKDQTPIKKEEKETEIEIEEPSKVVKKPKSKPKKEEVPKETPLEKEEEEGDEDEVVIEFDDDEEE